MGEQLLERSLQARHVGCSRACSSRGRPLSAPEG